MKPITFLSDYGYEDEFAGVCRAVIARIAPDAVVIELTHGIAPQDVRRGAFALAAALPFAPAGVHMAVVDPGVGTSRRPIAVVVSEHVLVGPDNGLLSFAIERLGGVAEAVDLSGSRFNLNPVSATFHGRDIFAPVAAHLALGAAVSEAGEPIDPSSLAQLAAREPIIGDDHVAAHVAYIDRFGNVALDLPAARIPEGFLSPGSRVVIGEGANAQDAVCGRTFGDAAEGGLLVYEDAVGNLTIAVNRGSARARLEVEVDDQLLIRPA